MVDVVAAATGRELEVEVDAEEAVVQSSQALPFSAGQVKLMGLYVEEDEVGTVDVVVTTGETYKELEVELVDDKVQSSQALPFSDGQV